MPTRRLSRCSCAGAEMRDRTADVAADPMPEAPERMPLAPQHVLPSRQEAVVSERPTDALGRMIEQLGELHEGYLRAMGGQQTAFLASQQDVQDRLVGLSRSSQLGASPPAFGGLVEELLPRLRSTCESVPSLAAMAREDSVAERDRVTFSAESVEAFYEGRHWDCFGEPLRMSRCHVRTPALDSRALRCLTCVSLSNSGVVQAEAVLSAEPFGAEPLGCLVEVVLQTLAFAAIGRGMTLERDGWRLRRSREFPLSTCRSDCRRRSSPSSTANSRESAASSARTPAEESKSPTLHRSVHCRADNSNDAFGRNWDTLHTRRSLPSRSDASKSC